MPTYTLVITGAENGHQHKPVTDFPNDTQAITDAREVLTEEHVSVAVGRGTGEAVEWLGVWDWCAGEPRWTRED